MTYSPIAIANRFLNLGALHNVPISPMKIQKLVYLAHGYSLIERKKPLVNELFEAWRFGPVLPTLYHACKQYGEKGIDQLLKEDSSSKNLFDTINDDSVEKIILFVWKQYGRIDAMELSAWTHEVGGPWDQVTQKRGPELRNVPIENVLISEYFERCMVSDDLETP